MTTTRPAKARKRGFVLAIDGPAGSGKSTTARGCAVQLGFLHIDTGAMYRAVTLKLLRSGVDYRNRAVLARVLRRTRLDMRWRSGVPCVIIDGIDVSREIRAPEVSAEVSEVSAIPMLRREMVKAQRRLAVGRDVVCEGRDIGSVVFPDADVKVYLDCDPGIRSGRRERELREGGMAVKRRQVAANLNKRDRIDSGRRVAPLRRVADAVLVDTSMLMIEEQVAVVCGLVQRALARR